MGKNIMMRRRMHSTQTGGCAARRFVFPKTFKLVYLAALCGAALVSCSQGEGPSTPTPKHLFESIRTYADEGRYDEIGRLMVGLSYRGEESIPAALENIRTEAYPSNGDFAFSRAGLQALIDRHLGGFTPVDAKTREQMTKAPGYAACKQLQQALVQDPEGVQILAIRGVHVLIARIDGNFRLIFWEHLPRLAKPS